MINRLDGGVSPAHIGSVAATLARNFAYTKGHVHADIYKGDIIILLHEIGKL